MDNIDVVDETVGKFWVVVADSSTARFLHGTSPRAELHEFHVMKNIDGRKSGKEIDTDAPGRRSDSGSGHRSAMPTNPVDHARRTFAAEVCDWLEEQRAKDRFQRLSIVAAPKFLGELRNRMSSPLAATVLEEVDKNLTGHSDGDIRDTLERLAT